MRVLNYLIDDYLFHFRETCDELPELVFGNYSYRAVRHALNAVGWITVENDLDFANERAFFEISKEYALS